MVKTLRLTFELSNAYKVNSVLYFIRQIPLIGKRIPESLYEKRWLKILAQVIALIMELLSAVSGKLLYFGVAIFLPVMLYESDHTGTVFVHIYLLMTLMGAKINNYIINMDNPTYYAVLLLGMDARRYTLVGFGYNMAKLLIAYIVFGLIFGLMAGVPVWLCLLLPLAAMGAKCAVAALEVRDFEKHGEVYRETLFSKIAWVVYGLLLAAAYGLPIMDIAIPMGVSAVLMVLLAFAGLVGLRQLLKYQDYRLLIQRLWLHYNDQAGQVETMEQQASREAISDKKGITSNRRGFAYLNDLFIKRHGKILWKPAIRTALAAAALILLASGMLYFIPEIRQELQIDVMGLLPVFAFVLYGVNRGTSYTQALFMNCDNSLLSYSFYKQPKMILKLFQIRLREIVKVNLLPGTVIALGLPLLLYASGGTENPTDYPVLFVSIISMNIFFSVHYLTIYYLLQPYNAGSELKSVPYQIATGATYAVCYGLMVAEEIPPMIFGICAIVFCLAYCVIACVLVYFLAPKTFRIRL